MVLDGDSVGAACKVLRQRRVADVAAAGRLDTAPPLPYADVCVRMRTYADVC